MTEERRFRVRVRHGDLEVEVEGDKNFLDETLGEYAELLKAVLDRIKVATEGRTAPPSAAPHELPDIKEMSVREFFDSKGPEHHRDYIMVFAYYLEKVKGFDSFTGVDIDKCYYDSRMDKSKTATFISRNIRRGLMMESAREKGKRIRFVLTRKGEQYVEGGLKLPETES